jgi:hypothetical protein
LRLPKRSTEAPVRDIYAKVYEAERSELLFKFAGWSVVPHLGLSPDLNTAFGKDLPLA